MGKVKSILKTFLLWRTLLFIPLILASSLLVYRSGYDYTNIFHYTKPYFPVESPLLFPWANFDGVHYLAIAARGYITEARFFPLFPLVIGFFAKIFGGGEPFSSSYFFSGLFFSNISFLFALFYFYKLLRLDYSDKVSFSSIVFLLVFPTSFFFASIYTEGVFFLFLVLSFYWARKGSFLKSSIAAALLSSTRLVGILILPALFYEYIDQQKGEGFLEKLKLLSLVKTVKEVLPFLLIPVGLVAFSYFNLKMWGDPLYFIKAHGELANARSVSSVILLPQTVYRYFKILVTIPISQYEWFLAAIEIGSVVFALSLLFIAWKKRVRGSYLVFSLLSLLIPASSGTFSGMPRYVLILFPVFIALSMIKSKTLRTAYVVISSVLLFALLMLFSRGFFVA